MWHALYSESTMTTINCVRVCLLWRGCQIMVMGGIDVLLLLSCQDRPPLAPRLTKRSAPMTHKQMTSLVDIEVDHWWHAERHSSARLRVAEATHIQLPSMEGQSC